MNQEEYECQSSHQIKKCEKNLFEDKLLSLIDDILDEEKIIDKGVLIDLIKEQTSNTYITNPLIIKIILQ